MLHNEAIDTTGQCSCINTIKTHTVKCMLFNRASFSKQRFRCKVAPGEQHSIFICYLLFSLFLPNGMVKKNISGGVCLFGCGFTLIRSVFII